MCNRSARRFFAGASALLASLLGACAEPPPAPATRPRNLIVVLVDTLRADHLASYGYSRTTSPVFDRFAAAGLFLAEARSQAACTFPSANAILTGRSPVRFLGQPGGRMGIPADTPSLATILRQRGFATAAVSASPIVRAKRTKFNPTGGFDAGFDLFDEDCLWREAACVTARAADWLATRTAAAPPFFLYLHYMDPHGPYRPPAAHRMRFAGPYDGPDFIRLGDPNPIARMLYAGGPKVEVTRTDLAHLTDLYDDEIAVFDESFGELLDRLEPLGLADSTVVAVVSDHGEEFLEHGEIKHCHALWDAEIRVPLAIRVPGRPPRRSAAAAETIALVPTVLEALGIDPSAYDLEARSLLAEVPRGGVAMSAQGVLRAATDGRYKLVYDMATGGLALFDLRADPGERRDVAAMEPASVAALRAPLFAWLQQVEGAIASQHSLDTARETERQLRALGYLSGTTAETR